jgi:glycosyltransferase involved in cell wall biosynthesis
MTLCAGRPMNRISFCMITLNEDKNLPRALKSVQGVADEIVVVDCGSMDRTLELARQYGAKTFFRAWTNFGDQRNYAVSQSTCEWIYALDADEELSEELRASLLAWKKSDAKRCAYEMSRLTWYLGGWVRHSGWYPNKQRRLYRKDAAKYRGIVHETLEFQGEAGKLSGDLLHYTVENFAEHEANAEKYSTLSAQKMFEEGKRNWRGAKWIATPWSFLRSFVIQLGFLDGKRGALIARMAARTTRLKFAKLGKLAGAESKNKGQK